jgi:hypothetical protein
MQTLELPEQLVRTTVVESYAVVFDAVGITIHFLDPDNFNLSNISSTDIFQRIRDTSLQAAWRALVGIWTLLLSNRAKGNGSIRPEER